MKLNDLFNVVSDGQEIKLIGDAFDEVNGLAEGLKTALNKDIIEMTVSGVEAMYGGELKVWVEDNA